MTTVLLVSPTGAPGGAERALLNLARRLPDVGYQPQVVLLQPGPFEEWLAEASVPAEVLAMGRTRQLPRTAAVLARLCRRCRQADLVVANQSKGQAIAGVAAAAARVPCVWWQHGVPGRSRIELVAAAVPSAAVVCGSMPAYWAQRRCTPRRRIERIPPGIDIEAIEDRRGSGAAVRKQFGVDDRPLVGMVARLQPWKGQDMFLRAAALVAAEPPEVRFAIVGGAVPYVPKVG